MMYRDVTKSIMDDDSFGELEKYDKCEFWLEQELERVREGRREHINKNNLNKDDKKGGENVPSSVALLLIW